MLKSGTKTILERNPRDGSVVVSMDEYAIITKAYFSCLMGTEKDPNRKLCL